MKIHVDDYYPLLSSMLGGAQKEKQPLSLRNGAEQRERTGRTTGHKPVEWVDHCTSSISYEMK